MKKILLILLFTIFFIPNVDADTYTTYEAMYQDYIPFNNFTFYNGQHSEYFSDGYIYSNFDRFYQSAENKSIFNTLYYQLINFRNNYVDIEKYPKYRVSVIIKSTTSSAFKLNAVMLNLYIYDNSDETIITLRNSYILGTFHTPLAIFNDSDSYAISLYSNLSNTGFRFMLPSEWNYNNFYDKKYYNPFNSIPFKANDNGTFYFPYISCISYNFIKRRFKR